MCPVCDRDKQLQYFISLNLGGFAVALYIESTKLILWKFGKYKNLKEIKIPCNSHHPEVDQNVLSG